MLSNYNIFYRNLHTIKGNARIYGLSLISKLAHDTESKIEDFNFSYRKKDNVNGTNKLYIKAVLKTFDEKVDWFYVDAAHDEKGCYNDLVNSYNHLKKHGGGFLFGDDYGNKPGVVKAVDKFKAEYNLTMNVFHKNQYEMIV